MSSHTTAPSFPPPLYTPSEEECKQTRLYQFISFLQDQGESIASCPPSSSYEELFQILHHFSLKKSEKFWEALWDFTDLIGDKGEKIIEACAHVPWARFFPDSHISYTENILKAVKDMPDKPAIIARCQGEQDTVLSWQALYDEVSRWEQALRKAGLTQGERIGVYLPQTPLSVIIFLAAANIGAVFSSAGMEMGADDLINRFKQVRPKILIAQEGYIYGEKYISRLDVIKRAQDELPALTRIIIVSSPDHHKEKGANEIKEKERIKNIEQTASYPVQKAEDFLLGLQPQSIKFIRRPFNHPLYILFSSGSTGAPKCFEHSSGGVLIKHLCEQQLHINIKAQDRIFYHATPSWMMWNWLVSALASGATLLMHEGNPFYPQASAQLDFTLQNACTHHGTAAPLILSWAAHNISLTGRDEELKPLHTLIYTGAVLPAQGFEYIHKHIKSTIKIAPISGGTDLVGCFLGGNPFMPTYAGQINGSILGLDVQIWDEEGQEPPIGQAGELVCTNPFPSMPLRFVNDEEGRRYEEEYFEHFPGQKVWRHGDSVLKTPQGQFILIGRSDATLNQNGVRIGTNALYEQLEPFHAQIKDAAAVDFIHPRTKQALTILCLALKPEKGEEKKEREEKKKQGKEQNHNNEKLYSVNEALQRAIKKSIKNNITPYAVPAEIFAVSDILKTPNGKKAEVVIKKIINGENIPNPSLYGERYVKEYEALARKLHEKYN